MADKFITALVSLLAIVGYLAFGFLLLTGHIQPHVAGDVALTLTGAVFGALTFAFAASVHFWVGSSFGSRSKDGLIGQLAKPTAPSGTSQPLPCSAPSDVPQTPSGAKPPAPTSPRNVGITATVFSEDEADNAKVAYPDVKPGWSRRHGVALPAHFHGARPRVQVWGAKGSATCEIVDVGPWYDGRPGWPEDPYWTTGGRPRAESNPHTNGAGIDLTPAAAAAVGIDGRGRVDWAFVDTPTLTPHPSLQGGGSASGANANEPPWLALARAEIGFHELPDNHGIGKYVAGAGFGADGDPWCSIFAGWALRTAGIDISGANAMARSWATAPCVARVDTPQPGDLAVFWRGSRDGSSGHVGFYVGSAGAGRINVLGGNENDQVMIEALPVNGSSMGLLGYWRPRSAKVT